MKKITVIVATSANMDIDNILVRDPDKVMQIVDNFQLRMPPIGVGRLFKENGALMCEMVLRPDMEEAGLDLYPAVGGQFVKSPSSNYCLSGLIHTVSLCSTPNVDKNIRTLRQQLTPENNEMPPLTWKVTDTSIELSADVKMGVKPEPHIPSLNPLYKNES
jgi:hypothetical protein